jgi:hypothetical protein
MRTTIEIDADIFRALKESAHLEGLSFRAVLNAALRKGMSAPGRPGARRYRCPRIPMGHVTAAGADLDKALALASAMEDAEIARKLELRK